LGPIGCSRNVDSAGLQWLIRVILADWEDGNLRPAWANSLQAQSPK
jgi:hypothetical protein